MENLLEYLSRGGIKIASKGPIRSENASYKSFKYCLVTEIIGTLFTLREIYATLIISKDASRVLLYKYKGCDVWYNNKKYDFVKLIDPILKENPNKTIAIHIKKNSTIDHAIAVDISVYNHMSEYMYTIIGGKNVEFYDNIDKKTIDDYCKKIM